LHALTDDIGDFIKPAVVHFFHGVEDTALNRFQSISDGGYGPFEDYIGCVIQEPVFILSGDSGFVFVKIVGYLDFGHVILICNAWVFLRCCEFISLN